MWLSVSQEIVGQKKLLSVSTSLNSSSLTQEEEPKALEPQIDNVSINQQEQPTPPPPRPAARNSLKKKESSQPSLLDSESKISIKKNTSKTSPKITIGTFEESKTKYREIVKIK